MADHAARVVSERERRKHKERERKVSFLRANYAQAASPLLHGVNFNDPVYP